MSWRLSISALALVACSKPAPSPTAAANCSTCHAAEARSHEASFHRVAFSDATFQASLALEEPKQRKFCVDCHAPQGAVAGVGCASCHGAPHEPGQKLVAANTCANCHQFKFDDGRADLVQKTVDEHRASEFANIECATCHVRGGDHGFTTGHAPDTLRASVDVKVTRLANDQVHVEIRSIAGHAFPTGDMFRRARLMIFAEDAKGSIVGSAEREFGRTWGATRTGLREERSDTRIRGHFAEDIALGADRPVEKITYRLLFERVLAQRGQGVTLVSSDPIAEGELR